MRSPHGRKKSRRVLRPSRIGKRDIPVPVERTGPLAGPRSRFTGRNFPLLRSLNCLQSILTDLGEVLSCSFRDGEVIFEKELGSSSSYFQMRNVGILVTSVTVTILKIWLKK